MANAFIIGQGTGTGAASGANASVGLNGAPAPLSSTEVGFVGPTGNEIGVSASNPLPVVIEGTITSLNPSVGATGAAAPAFATEIGVITAGGNLVGASATNPVRIDPTGTTVQPVSGTITANQGTSPWVVSLASTTITGSVAVTGTFWQATQPVSGTITANQGTSPWVVSLTSTTITGTVAVTGTFWQATQPISGTITANQGTSPWVVSLASTTITGTVITAGNLTNNNAVPGATNFGALIAIANLAHPTYTEGDQVLLSTDLQGNTRTYNTPIRTSSVLSTTPLASGSGLAPITYVGSSNGTTQSVPYTSTAGNLLVLIARLTNNGTDGQNPTDSHNTWVSVFDDLEATQAHRLWYAANCFGGANTISLPTYDFYQWVILEYAHVMLASPKDQSNSHWIAGSGTTNQTGSITPTQNNELIVSMSANDSANGQSESIDSGMTVRNSAAGNPYGADIVQTVAAAINPTWTDNTGAISKWFAGTVSFKAAALVGTFTYTQAWQDATLNGTNSVEATVRADQASATLGFTIQETDDTSNSNFFITLASASVAANTLTEIRASIRARYYRVVYQNGVTAQGSMELTTTAISIDDAPAIANAAAPTWLEAVPALLSVDLAGNLRVINAAGTSTIGNVDILGNAGAILDAVTTAATAPANGLAVLGVNTTTPPSLTTGQSVAVQVDYEGSVFVKPIRRSETVAQATTISMSSGATTVLAAQAAGIFADISAIYITVTPAATTDLSFTATLSDGTNNFIYDLNTGAVAQPSSTGTLQLVFNPPLPATTAATVWTITLSINTVTCHITVVAVTQKAS